MRPSRLPRLSGYGDTPCSPVARARSPCFVTLPPARLSLASLAACAPLLRRGVCISTGQLREAPGQHILDLLACLKKRYWLFHVKQRMIH